MNRTKKSIATVAMAAAAMIGVSSIAYAVFSETSTASATGAAADMKPLTVGTGKDAPVIDFAGAETFLWPNVNGSHVATVKIQVTNPNEVGVQVLQAGITGNATFNSAADEAACGAFLSVTDPIVLSGGSVNVPAGAAGTLTVTGVVLAADAPNTCQNKPFTTSWTIVGNAY